MRKHFLILMLLALLPFTAWAQTAITDLVAPTTITYGDAFTLKVYDSATQEVPTSNYTVAYYTDEACTELVSGTNPQTFNQGSYWVKVTADGNTYSGELKQSLTINKAALTVNVGVDADFAVIFLNAANTKPALPATLAAGAATSGKITVAGAKNGELIADLLTVTSGGTYTYAGETTGTVLLAANADPTGALLNPLNLGYAIDFTNSHIALKTTGAGAKGGNYTITFAPRYMKVMQKTIALTDYAATATTDKFTVTRGSNYNPSSKPAYTGAAQNLAYAVAFKYGSAAAAVYNFQASDFVVKYKSTSVYTDAIDAKEYTPVISLKANGNFYAADDIDLSASTGYSEANLNYEIARKNLFVLLNENTKVYDGTEFLASSTAQPTPTFNFSSLVGQDAGKEVTGLAWDDLEKADGVTLAPDVDSYGIKFKNTAFDDAKIVRVPASTYTAETAAAHNAELPGAISTSTFTLTATSTPSTTEYNTACTTTLADNTVLTAEQIAAYNATLGSAVSSGDPIPAVEVALGANYTIVGVASNWTITPKDIVVNATVTYASGTSITYGDDLPTIALTVTGAINGTEEGKVIAAYKYTTADKNNVVVGPNNITIARKTTEDYLAAYWEAHAPTTPGSPTAEEIAAANAAVATQLAAADAVVGNYNPDVKTPTFKVTGVGLTIIPNIAATMQYGTTPNPTCAAFNSKTLAPVTLADTPVFVYRKSTETKDDYTTEVPTTVGHYFVSVDDNDALAPATGYDPDQITYEETPFEITKKELDFTIDDVTLHTGDTKTILNQYGKVTLKAGYSLVGEEKIDPEFTFQAVGTLTVGDEAADYAITGDPGDYVGAIVASLPEGVANNDNYVLKAGVAGKLIIAAGRNLYIAGNDVYVNNKISDAAIACATAPALSPIVYNVTFAPRTLVANDWNVVVLPFDITPYEFTEAIKGYAIFNTLRTATPSTNTVKFGLELANLPANEPFLVKPLNAVELEWDSDDNPETYTPANIKFTGRTVKYAETPAKTDVAGVKFVGTYLTKHVLVAGTDVDADFGYVNDGGEAGSKISFLYKDGTKNAAWYSATNTAGTQSYNWLNLESTKAYLDFNESSLSRPTIIVEEADGSTTAISAITNDGVAVQAEGWYTIDGMKLNAAPTQKGVYINNGKKVVVK